MDAEKIQSRMVQTGIVTDVDAGKRMVRVKFPDTGNLSGWLHVVQHYAAALSIVPDAGHTHTITDTFTGGGSASTFPAHSHPGSTVTWWMPKKNDLVLVLYVPVDDGDGFVLGGL